MTAKRMTRTYEGRMPAQPMIEQGALWIPVEHHIEGVFENVDGVTTITYEQAEGALAEETLALAQQYRTLSEQADRKPHPEDFFAMQAVTTLPSDLGEPVERSGWQLYSAGEAFYASYNQFEQGQYRMLYYRLTPKTPDGSLNEARGRFERAIVTHGHKRIELKEINTRMGRNANELKRHMLQS
ncbi:hypothetical protein GCM10027040_14010 [Halomonas shantousis]